MKQLFATALICILGMAGAHAAAESAEDVVRQTTSEVLTRLDADKDALKSDPKRLFELIDEVVLPKFDFERMSRWVLGRNWNAADAAAQEQFVYEFRRLLVRTYGTALLEYSNQRVNVLPATAEEGAGTVTVRTEVLRADGRPIAINYRLHESGGEWKVFDVAIEGVSLVSTYRSSFADEVRKGGIDGLIRNLSSRNDAGSA